MQLLLRVPGVRVNARTWFGATAVGEAAGNGHREVVAALREAGAERPAVARARKTLRLVVAAPFIAVGAVSAHPRAP